MRSDELPAYERPIPGIVRVMTDEPLVLGDDSSAIRERIAKVVNQRPWVIPVVLLACGALFLLLRRRR